jgi:hypothetical protein
MVPRSVLCIPWSQRGAAPARVVRRDARVWRSYRSAWARARSSSSDPQARASSGRHWPTNARRRCTPLAPAPPLARGPAIRPGHRDWRSGDDVPYAILARWWMSSVRSCDGETVERVEYMSGIWARTEAASVIDACARDRGRVGGSARSRQRDRWVYPPSGVGRSRITQVVALHAGVRAGPACYAYPRARCPSWVPGLLLLDRAPAGPTTRHLAPVDAGLSGLVGVLRSVGRSQPRLQRLHDLGHATQRRTRKADGGVGCPRAPPGQAARRGARRAGRAANQPPCSCSRREAGKCGRRQAETADRPLASIPLSGVPPAARTLPP